ncbi:MAG: phosphoenolpyruvate--protein phosphotransferase [Anaerovibrio sp.]|uniref:phosphoenolpyruvate--protein phosphotransferase n=1 Tax=Anaerovibrio sp. TaxID=1872532 RepID=UPI0025BA162A|nr:phosphoenolpyruvate--protein phosphotransferase [Anaerovibrio sp.]MBE6098957.1 phosphoenolpyruvate--protein phosphotransferase [Anaerovibrio sp.]
MSVSIQGNVAIEGISIGKIVKVDQSLDGYVASYTPGTAEEELAKLEAALETISAEIDESVEKMRAAGQDEQADIMEAHSFLLMDPMFTDMMNDKARELANAPAAVLAAANETAEILANMEDEYMRERSQDVHDIGRRVARFVLGVKGIEVGDEPIILCGHEVEPSVIANIPDDKLAGVIMGQGSTTCHAVIIAKSRAITTIVGLEERIGDIPDGAKVLMDGNAGMVIVEPTQDELSSYEKQMAEQQAEIKRYEAMRDLPAETTDGKVVQLTANIGLPDDAEAAIKYGNQGVGLFRSEFIFMGRDTIPSEELQYENYKKAILACKGELCVIRTMDIGGDKPLPYLNIAPEDNPFLGYRAVRISLGRPELFMPQLRAILRAGVFGKAAIMVPMVISVDEVKSILTMVDKAKAELETEGKEYAKDVQVGIMVETPAAAVMTPVLAKYVDFFSIGTNDLVQYTLAVDRINPQVSKLYDHFHPAVLQLIQRTIQAGCNNGKWVGMCGEMASDPYAAVILMAMGITELSMSAPSIPKVKEKIRSVSMKEAKAHLAKVMELETGVQVREYLKANL